MEQKSSDDKIIEQLKSLISGGTVEADVSQKPKNTKDEQQPSQNKNQKPKRAFLSV